MQFIWEFVMTASDLICYGLPRKLVSVCVSKLSVAIASMRVKELLSIINNNNLIILSGVTYLSRDSGTSVSAIKITRMTSFGPQTQDHIHICIFMKGSIKVFETSTAQQLDLFQGWNMSCNIFILHNILIPRGPFVWLHYVDGHHIEILLGQL